MSFVSSSTAPRTMKTHLEVFRPLWWIVWTQSTNLKGLGILRYSNNRLCDVQASHPRSYLLLWLLQCIVVELGMILLSARTVWLSVQRDDGKCSSLKWTRNQFLCHHHPAMGLEVVVNTRLILPKDFLVFLPSLGGPGLRWMFSEPDLHQITWLFHLRSGIMFSPFWALTLPSHCVSWQMRPSFPIPQCLRPKCLLSRFSPRIIHNRGIFQVRLSCRTAR